MARFDYGVPSCGHLGPRVHAGARQRARRVRGPARVARLRDHHAGGHLRRRARRCGPPSRRPGPSSARCGSTAATCPRSAVSVRALLDSLGATSTRIILTGDLDEYSIAGLAVAPVDGYGVGTSLVTGSGAPTAALVYKLVARSDEPLADGAPAGPGALRPVAKRSVGKPGRGGRKWAVRERVRLGVAATERIWLAPPARARRRPTARCCRNSSATARSSAGSRSRPRGRGTPWCSPSCPRTRCSSPAATRRSPRCSALTARIPRRGWRPGGPRPRRRRGAGCRSRRTRSGRA